MKRTGRTLTLTNAITTTANVPNSIAFGGFRLTTIFQDDREGYAWKVKSMQRFGTPSIRLDEGFTLFTTQPDSFTSLNEFRQWALQRAVFSNQMIATIVSDLNAQLQYRSLKENHMAVNHLALFYVDGDLPTYVIELEEYQISDNEEIIYRIKEIGQSLNEIGE